MSQNSALQFLGPQWFAPVMGWAGLGLAWHRASSIMGVPAKLFAAFSGAVALLIFVVVATAFVWRAMTLRQALLGDIAHPVRHAFFATIPVSLLLLATLTHVLISDVEAGGQNLGPVLGRLPLLFWLVAVVFQVVVSVWVLSRCLREGFRWQAMTPVLFIPIVGNVVVPLAGVPLGFHTVSWIFLGVGVFFWPIFLSLILMRESAHPIPLRLVPSWFILIAPPAVIGASLLGLLGHAATPSGELGAGSVLALMMFGIGAITFAMVAGLTGRLFQEGFGMPHWAMSFPVAALAGLSLAITDLVEPNLAPVALLLLALATAIIVFLSLATWRGLKMRQLLVAETVAISPAT